MGVSCTFKVELHKPFGCNAPCSHKHTYILRSDGWGVCKSSCEQSKTPPAGRACAACRLACSSMSLRSRRVCTPSTARSSAARRASSSARRACACRAHQCKRLWSSSRPLRCFKKLQPRRSPKAVSKFPHQINLVLRLREINTDSTRAADSAPAGPACTLSALARAPRAPAAPLAERWALPQAATQPASLPQVVAVGRCARAPGARARLALGRRQEQQLRRLLAARQPAAAPAAVCRPAPLRHRMLGNFAGAVLHAI